MNNRFVNDSHHYFIFFKCMFIPYASEIVFCDGTFLEQVPFIRNKEQENGYHDNNRAWL